MHLGDDDILYALDDLNDSLAASRAALESIAARHLSFQAQVRVQRASTQRARAYLRSHAASVIEAQRSAVALGLPETYVAREETDEILLQTLGSGQPLDIGSEELVSISDDPLASLDLSVDESLDDDDEEVEFVSFDEDEDAAVIEDDEPASYVVFDDDDDDSSAGEVIIGLDDPGLDDPGSDAASDALMFDDLDDLEDEASVDPDSATDVEELVGLGPTDDLVTLGGEGADISIEVEMASQSPDDAPPPEDATLVTDLESLVRLQDMIAEDEAPGAAHAGQGTPVRPEPRIGDPVRVTTTLTDDDLDRLGFSSTDQLVAPEGADADPHSETGSRPAIRIPSPGPEPEAGAVSSESGGGPTYTPPRGASIQLGASLPTIRDQQASRPTAAAIRIDPSGGGRAVQQPEEEALALGGADFDDEDYADGEGGFSLDVEEYELVEEEVEEVEEVESEPEPPPPMPTISADQETRLLRQADAAYARGELPVAADLYSDLLDFNPDNGLAALGRGRVYLDLGDYARAMSDFTVAEDLRDDDPDVHAAIGELYYARKDYQRAIDYFDEALERNDRHAMAWCRRGIAHYYRKDYDKAYKDLVKAQKLDDAIPNIRTYIGMVKKKRR